MGLQYLASGTRSDRNVDLNARKVKPATVLDLMRRPRERLGLQSVLEWRFGVLLFSRARTD
jgi:hypothetical protein